MKPSRRVRIFGVGFLGGCILAAGIALFRAKDEPPPPPSLPEWSPLQTTPELPEREGPYPPDLTLFRAWKSDPDTIRWIARDPRGNFWRISGNGGTVDIVRADRIRVFGNPGIEVAALEAGLEHNGFDIIDFHPGTTAFIVPVAPFEPNAIEEARRLLESRRPYIRATEPIVFESETN